MPASSSSPIHPVLAHLAAAADANRITGASLLATLARVPDPRARRSVRHQISAVLALAVCAVPGRLPVVYRDRRVVCKRIRARLHPGLPPRSRRAGPR
jgi:hypothetical protein